MIENNGFWNQLGVLNFLDRRKGPDIETSDGIVNKFLIEHKNFIISSTNQIFGHIKGT